MTIPLVVAYSLDGRLVAPSLTFGHPQRCRAIQSARGYVSVRSTDYLPYANKMKFASANLVVCICALPIVQNTGDLHVDNDHSI